MRFGHGYYLNPLAISKAILYKVTITNSYWEFGRLVMVNRTASVVIAACFLLTALIPLFGSLEAIPQQTGNDADTDGDRLLGSWDKEDINSDGSVNLNAKRTARAGELQAGSTKTFEANVPVRGTYLFADNDAAEWDDNGDGTMEKHYLDAPLIVDLTANGFSPGDEILINATGAVHYAANADWSLFWSGASELWCVFSSSSTVLWQSQGNEVGPLHRVPGAIDAREPFESPPTFIGYPTDIPEDFFVPESGTSIRIPLGATYLIVSGIGAKFTDNDGWIKVTIEANDKDTDGDGLLDSWENEGIDSDDDGDIDLVLEGADWQHKDIFVEVDYMEGHKPMDAAMADVKAAFSHAPNTLVDNPDNKDGVNLHILVDEQINHQDVLYVWEGFDSIKSYSFGSFDQRTADNRDDVLLAKKMAFRYCLFINQFARYDNKSSSFVPSNASGVSELPGNDFIVSLGTFPTHGGTRDEQAATFMHELGHSLNLRHGGDVNENYKPNYLSIMNYLFVFEGDPIPNRPLDYSRSALPTIDENALDEMKGVSPNAYEPSYHANWVMTAYSDAIGQPNSSSLNPINWNNDSSFNSSVSADINNFVCWHSPSGKKTPLTGYEDWSHLLYDFKGTAEYADGMHQPVMDEITSDIAKMMSEYRFEILPTPNPDGGGDNTMLYIGIGGVAILVIAGVAFVMMRRRK